MVLVGEAANGLEAIDCFPDCRPDITLMDLQMPQMGGIDAMIDNRWELHIAQGGIALGLLALGPGAWSIDARLYGRKHIDI